MEDLVFAPDSAEQSSQLAGFGGAPVAIDKSQTVDEELHRSPMCRSWKTSRSCETSCSTPAIVIPTTR